MCGGREIHGRVHDKESEEAELLSDGRHEVRGSGTGTDMER